MSFSENNPSYIDDGNKDDKKVENKTESLEQPTDNSPSQKNSNPREVIVASEKETNSFSADFGLYRQGMLSKVEFFNSFSALPNEKKRDVLTNTTNEFFNNPWLNNISLKDNITNLLSASESLPEISVPASMAQIQKINEVCKDKNIDHRSISQFLENYRTIIELVQHWELAVDTRGGVKYDFINPVRRNMSNYIQQISADVKSATNIDYMSMAGSLNADRDSGAILVFDEAIVQWLKKLGDDIPPLQLLAKQSPTRQRRIEDDY